MSAGFIAFGTSGTRSVHAPGREGPETGGRDLGDGSRNPARRWVPAMHPRQSSTTRLLPLVASLIESTPLQWFSRPRNTAAVRS